MRTAELVDELALGVRPVGRNAAQARLLAALAAGGALSFVVLLAWLGVRPDIAAVLAVPGFWMKWAFTLSLGLAAFVMVARLARPDGEVGLAWWGTLAPVAVVAAMAAIEVLRASPEGRGDLVMGHTALQCALAIPALGIPVFAGLIWAFRRLAPTQLRLAGAASGLLAGAAGAAVYVLTCPEHTAAFMVAWYDAGILLAGLVGALLGPRLLRW